MMGIAETRCSLCKETVDGEDTEYFNGGFNICPPCIQKINPKILSLKAEALKEQADMLLQVSEAANGQK